MTTKISEQDFGNTLFCVVANGMQHTSRLFQNIFRQIELVHSVLD